MQGPGVGFMANSHTEGGGTIRIGTQINTIDRINKWSSSSTTEAHCIKPNFDFLINQNT